MVFLRCIVLLYDSTKSIISFIFCCEVKDFYVDTDVVQSESNHTEWRIHYVRLETNNILGRVWHNWWEIFFHRTDGKYFFIEQMSNTKECIQSQFRVPMKFSKLLSDPSVKTQCTLLGWKFKFSCSCGLYRYYFFI